MDEGCGDGGGGKNGCGGSSGGGGGGMEEDVDVGDCSEEEEEEEEDMDMASSPIPPDQSTINSMPSPAMPYEGLASPLRVGPVALPGGGGVGGGKPVMRRGPGRPRTRGGITQPQVRTKRPIGLKLKRWKGLLVSGVYGTGNGKVSQEGEADESTSPIQPSTPIDQQIKAPIFVDEPLFSEQWPGKLCILCNLSEHSQLGQGEMLRIECSVEDLPKDVPRDILMSPPELLPHDSTSPRQPLQVRRQKGPSKCRNAGTNGQEPVDELSLVGHVDIPEPGNIVDSGYIYIHEWCAVWCSGVSRSSNDRRRLDNVGSGVMVAVSRRCWHCGRYGAGVACAISTCSKHFHTPCAAASAAFQHPKTLLLICNQHIDHVATMPEFNDVSCQSCDTLGNVNNLVMCSICGNHYHGICIGNALHPGLRAGWQCSDCRTCQLCRISTEDSTRMLVCEACDKTYHPSCVRPAMSSVPKVGWKCKRCRLCSDCGARTPGGGLSSRWHSNYTVCDSCYQQRNKGFSCPVCHKAYRAAALREMVRCSQCQRFVHGTCDKEADFVSYHRKKEAHPDYQYICLACKNNTTDKLLVLKRKDSTEEAMLESSLSVSQESLLMGDDGDMDSEKSDDIPFRLTIGLGKGKPFCASKMAKKRLGLGVGPGRPKGSGKMSGISPLSHYQKRTRFGDFGRKRGAKPKMRGIFGVPGVGLQRPQSDCTLKTEDEPGGENKLVFCSAKDKFVLGQDMCVMCGSLGIDQEACLIACAQCGQCYHPYCVSVKVTKVMLQKGWRCLDCTVCEGCGQRNDEGRLILCDDCDISYHIYCMDPPLGSVPTGVWKCKWCAQCQTCGSDNPGVNSSWQNSCTQCGPCASRTSCPACLDTYIDGDLIIKCINCERWLHCMCDNINTEQEADACCSQGYTCILCRPSNMALVVPSTPLRVSSPEAAPDAKVSGNDYYVDGVCLSEVGLQQIKTLSMEHGQQPVRRKRPGFKRPQDVDIMATIESVVTGDQENGEGGKDTAYKDGMIWGSRESGPVPSPPEGFSLYTMESGMVILKRKKQRNLQKLGIGGFTAVKMRSSRFKDEEEGFLEDKPRRKPRCNKKRSKLAESYPSYLQEAFFGRDLLDTSKEAVGQDLESSSEESDDAKSNKVTNDKTISLTQDELKVIKEAKSKHDQETRSIKTEEDSSQSEKPPIKEEDEGNDGEALKDILTLPDNLLHTDLVNTIMKEQDGEIKSENIISADSGVSESPQLNESGSSQKDELSDILGPHFNIESMVRETGLPNMDSKDVEEIFKGVLTDESQESQSSGVFPLRGPTPGTPAHPQLSPQGIVPSGNLVGSRPISTLPSVVHSNLSSPVTFPSASPYNSEYSNSPQFSPEGSPWGGDENGCSYNQRTSIKMESDEALGQSATISAVLYANMNHPEWRTEYPNWSERCKQIVKKWRALPSEMKAPYLLQARENRTNLRMKKAQQMGKELSSGGGANESERSAAGKSSEVSCQPPVKITLPQQRGGTSPTAEQKLVSTASNTSPPLHSSETFPTTIPSHPSTIQYIPLNAPGIKATFHIIPNTIVTTSSTSSSSSSSTSETPAPPPPLARTIHYPPPNVLLQPVPPPLVVTSNPQQPSDQPGGLLQVTKAQQAPPHSNKRPPPTPVDTATTASTIAPTSTATSTLASSSPLSDQHIRVLTPSEIMRTLPSLGQETYDTSPSTVEQDKVQAAKTCREAEQERQWKQLQAMRQQQMLTQNRPQGITKVTRQISSDGTVVQYTNEPVSTQTHLTQQLQVSTTQDSPSLPVMSPRGAPQFTSPSGVKVVRPPTVVGAPVGGVPVGGVPRAQLRPPQPASFVPHPTVPTQQQQPQQPPPTVVRQPIPADEMNRQLRDLLQRHHTKQDASDGSPLLSPTVVNAPLQATTTPQLRLPITQVRPPTLQHHPAAQGIDARVRLLLQQQRAAATAFPSQVRVAAPRPHVDQFNLMTRPQQFHSITSQNATVVRASQPPTVAAEQVRIQQVERIQGREGGEEIPDSVTAELEKLEQEGGSMAEVEAVSAILGDLVEDDDELLAEMGADFNILEYADPELDNVSGGEKTNIFDDLEDEVEKKKHLNENRQVKTEEMVKQEHMDSTKSTKKAEHCPQSSGTSVAVTGGVAGSGVVTAATAEKQTEVTTVVDPSTIAVVSSTTSVPQPQPPQQNTLSTQGLPQVTVASSASFSSQFAAPTTPIPRLPTLQVGVQPAARAQVLAGSQGQGFMQIPPPPYPGPPPPYPGQQMRVGVPRTVVQPAPQQQQQQQQRRSLLLQELSDKMLIIQRARAQEQPLLLEELLEEEKREQEKQATVVVSQQGTGSTPLMSDADFEMLKADVLGTNPQVSSPPAVLQGPGLVPQPIRAPFIQRTPGVLQTQTVISRPPPPPPPPPPVETPAPPMPPDNVITEQDRQTQVQYEQWLQTNNVAVTQQLKFYETEVQKLRKIRKSLNSKQRQLRKNGNELSQRDAMELQRVTTEQAALQKYLEAARKQSRQHSMVMQEYHNKQEQKVVGSGGLMTVNIANNAGGGSPQSPALMSPGVTPPGGQQPPMPSPQNAAVSPLHTTSPRIGTPLLQTGDDKNDTSGLPSPRPPPMTPTPPSPQQFNQIRHPAMVSRFVRSPEAGLRPRMLVTQISGPSNTQVAYSAPRAFTSSPQPISSIVVSQQSTTNQTIRLSAPQSLTPQQLLQRQQQLQQQKQQLLQQQEINQQEVTKQLQERTILQQRQLSQEESLARQQQLHMLQRQQQLAQQNRQLLSQQGKVGQFRQILQQNQQQFSQVSHPLQSQSPLGQLQSGGSTSPMVVSQAQSPMPPSPIGNVQQLSTASSPMHPQSPMLPQFQPASSPMPQHSPRVQSYQTSNSPITPHSPMVYSGMQAPNSPMPQFSQPISPMPPQSPRVQQQYSQQQPPTSPMQQQFPSSPMPPRSPMALIGGSPMPMRRPSSTGGSVGSSPAERPRTPHDQQDLNNGGGGGGNPNNPMNPIPFPPDFGRFGYFRLGLRGGSPMWSGKTPPKKPPPKSEPSTSAAQNNTDENGKLAHPLKTSGGSLVCLDYNDFDDESRTPPMTPPAKPALIKKTEVGGPKTRQSEDTDSEMTVYDDIVLVESCKEANLEVEELQSALKGNVMSTVVSMPVVIDPAQIQMMDVESDLLEDCLVSSNLVVLDVENGSAENDCILEVVDKETDDILISEGILEDGIEESLKVDESELMNNSEELMDLEEDLPSSPPARKRMIGKVLPGEAIIKEDDKHVSDSPESPEDDIAETSPEPFIPTEISSTKEDLFKPDSQIKIQSRLRRPDDLPSQENNDRRVLNVQPNVVVSRTSVAPFTPVVTQRSFQICSERRLSAQQATVASLVQNAVNAAKQAAQEAQNTQKAATVSSSAPQTISTTSNVVKSSSAVATTTVHNIQGQFIPLSVSSKVEKTIKDNMIVVKESLKKEYEPHHNDSILVSIANACLDNNKASSDRKVIHDGVKLSDITDIKSEFLVNDKGVKNSHENETNFERTDKLQNEESLFDSKFSRHPWDHPTPFVNRERSKFEEQFHILNDGLNKIQNTKPTLNKPADNKIEQEVKEIKPREQNEEKDDKINVTLPCVNMSSSILEAQLTSMLRTTEQSSHPPKFVYTLINRTSGGNDIKKEVQVNNDHDTHEDLRMEGFAAQFHRSIKSEELKLLADIKEESNKNISLSNNRLQTNMKHNIYLPTSQIKSDTVVVGGKSYKIFQANSQASTSDILNICESTGEENLKIVCTSESDSVPKNHHLMEKMSFQGQNTRVHELLQQRVVSSSDKETRHITFSTAKTSLHQKDEPKTFLQLSTMLLPQKKDPPARTPEDSQNVLLKQLLQNTACATTTTASASLTSGGGTVVPQGGGVPSLPVVPSLEAQLARPVPPTPSALIPPVLSEPVKNSQQHLQQQKDIKPLAKTQPMEPTRVSTLDELLSPSVGAQLQPPSLLSQPHTQPCVVQPPPPPPPPPPPLPPPPPPPPPPLQQQQQQQQQQIHHQQVLIKREPVSLTQPGPVMSTMVEVKKEPTPVTSPVVVEVKKEVMSSDEMLSPGLRMEHEHAGEAALQDLKKTIKRRQYQQKRRQSLGKEVIGGTPKKRPRKSSKVEEDYDSFIDSLMSQLRQTPAMLICEPNLTYNFTASPIFGSGDLSKVNSSTRFGDLKGTYGGGYLPNENDYYNTLPFGDLPPRAPATPSTQRGFYNEEFAPLKLHSTKDEFDERKFDYNRERDNDTPDTVISSSSPECIMPELVQRFPGLQLIDSDSEDDKLKISRFSPDIPIIAPLALRAKPCRMYSDMDKENEGPHGKRHCDVTVTLTLSSQASDDVLSVLRNLANVLRIPVPVNYSITERSTQPSQKLGLYRIKGKDGKEGVPVDIQSILNGAAKFCRHCDVIILNNLMRKKASEMPLVAKQGEEELYFCSSACYTQLAIEHPPAVQCEKVDSADDVIGSGAAKKIKLEDVEPTRTDTKKGSPDSDISETSMYIGTRSGKKEKYNEKMSLALAPPLKKSPSRYRVWTTNSIPPPATRHKKPTDKEIAEMLFRLGITIQPPKQPEEVRVCLFCHQIGDNVTDGPARLLNYDVNKWVHLNCALWSDEVYETVSGGLVNVETALQNGSGVSCAYCNCTGATLKCYKMRCSLVYHLPCAVKDQCVFFKNKTLYCSSHVPKGEKENELTTLSVMRRVYISRDENRQVASVMHHSEQTHLMRVGSLLFLSVGQLLPHQLQAFHTSNYIYPIGYKILRMYWSMRVTNKRCRYICSIHEVEGKPDFRIIVQERGEPDLELSDTTARGVWMKVLQPMADKRRADGMVQLFPKYITGEDLFGLTEPAIVRVLESLPGVETLTDYRFKYGRNPLLELPLAINPTGCARSEGRPKGHWKRGAHTQRTCSFAASLRTTTSFSASVPLGGAGASNSSMVASLGVGSGIEPACPYSKQFVHSKSSQYKKMKQEWRNNVYLARSKIQGLGLYAARDLERHTMVIEYIGEIIRTELAETREKQYEAKNRGIYMFRLDEERVVDATLCGGLARYINHSCSPNCVAETVEVDRDVRIIIFTKRRINRGEELAYDYKFDIEDDQHKIPCNCGAPNCRKWMN